MKLSIELGKNSVSVDETKYYLGNLTDVEKNLERDWKKIEKIREETLFQLEKYSKVLLFVGISIVMTLVVAIIGNYSQLADTTLLLGMVYLVFLVTVSVKGTYKAEKELDRLTKPLLDNNAILAYVYYNGVRLYTEDGFYYHAKNRKRFFDTLRLVEEKDIEFYRLKHPYELHIDNHKDFNIEREVVLKYKEEYYLFARKGSGENLYAYQFIEFP